MNVLAWIVFGAIAGWIASAITRSNESLLMDIILGIIGALLGGWIMNSFGAQGVTGFNIYSFIVAIIGAIILLAIGKMFRGRTVT